MMNKRKGEKNEAYTKQERRRGKASEEAKLGREI